MTFDGAVSEAKRRSEALQRVYVICYSDKEKGPNAYLILRFTDSHNLPEHLIPVQTIFPQPR